MTFTAIAFSTLSDVVLLCHTDIGIVLSLEGCERSQLQLAEVEMESYGLPKSQPKSTTEPQYEGCGGGVISSNVAMEENPAYQSVDVAPAKPWTQSSIETNFV